MAHVRELERNHLRPFVQGAQSTAFIRPLGQSVLVARPTDVQRWLLLAGLGAALGLGVPAVGHWIMTGLLDPVWLSDHRGLIMAFWLVPLVSYGGWGLALFALVGACRTALGRPMPKAPVAPTPPMLGRPVTVMADPRVEPPPRGRVPWFHLAGVAAIVLVVSVFVVGSLALDPAGRDEGSATASVFAGAAVVLVLSAVAVPVFLIGGLAAIGRREPRPVEAWVPLPPASVPADDGTHRAPTPEAVGVSASGAASRRGGITLMICGVALLACLLLQIPLLAMIIVAGIADSDPRALAAGYHLLTWGLGMLGVALLVAGIVVRARANVPQRQ